MNLTTEKMREYQRERRAKLKPKEECVGCEDLKAIIVALKNELESARAELLRQARVSSATFGGTGVGEKRVSRTVGTPNYRFCDKHGKMNNMCGCK